MSPTTVEKTLSLDVLPLLIQHLLFAPCLNRVVVKFENSLTVVKRSKRSVEGVCLQRAPLKR